MNVFMEFVMKNVTCLITVLTVWFVIDTMVAIWHILKEKLGIGNDENR